MIYVTDAAKWTGKTHHLSDIDIIFMISKELTLWKEMLYWWKHNFFQIEQEEKIKSFLEWGSTKLTFVIYFQELTLYDTKKM